MNINGNNRRFGRRIIDAKHELCVHVKPEDIIGSICRDHQKCAVARAIKRRYKADWVDVGAHTVLIAKSKGGAAQKYRLSPAAKKQVQFFDNNKGAMAPCAIRLYVPYEFKQRVVRRPWTGKRKARRAKPTR